MTVKDLIEVTRFTKLNFKDYSIDEWLKNPEIMPEKFKELKVISLVGDYDSSITVTLEERL